MCKMKSMHKTSKQIIKFGLNSWYLQCQSRIGLKKKNVKKVEHCTSLTADKFNTNILQNGNNLFFKAKLNKYCFDPLVVVN